MMLRKGLREGNASADLAMTEALGKHFAQPMNEILEY